MQCRFEIPQVAERAPALLLVMLAGIVTIFGSGTDLTCEGDDCILDDDINGVWIEDSSQRIALISDHGWNVNIVGNRGDDQLAGRILSREGVVYDSILSAYSLPGGRLSAVYFCSGGTASPLDSISLDYTSRYSPGISLMLRHDPGLSDRSASHELIAGIWSYSDSLDYTLTLAIDSLGLLSGSDTNGCLYSGRIAIDNPSMNIYQVRIAQTGTAHGCGQYMPNGAGQGLLLDEVAANDHLLIAVTGDIAALASASIVFRLTRQ